MAYARNGKPASPSQWQLGGQSSHAHKDVMMQSYTHPLDALIGQELFGVTFVLDYIRLEFFAPEPDGFSLTLSVPPAVEVGPIIIAQQTSLQWNNVGYRDALCQCLGQKVKRIAVERDRHIVIEFDNDSTVLIPALPDSSPDYPVIFYDAKHTYSW